MCCSIITVTEYLSEFKNIQINKGWIPQRFSDVEHNRFCFVHIDVDLYQSTLNSISFFYPRMNAGGIILCDDCGFTSCPGATKAINDFLQNKKEKMISLSGGGLSYKRSWNSSTFRILALNINRTRRFSRGSNASVG
jgi:hypothetical protein